MTPTRALAIVLGACCLVVTLGVLQLVGVIERVAWVALSMLLLATVTTVFDAKGLLPRSRQR
ncbi:purine-cytosine permease-like protein [Actinopolyspora lacussalsi]|nr:purine-cytosine permease-like protein [Actinopolyspora lacussalsi]